MLTRLATDQNNVQEIIGMMVSQAADAFVKSVEILKVCRWIDFRFRFTEKPRLLYWDGYKV